MNWLKRADRMIAEQVLIAFALVWLLLIGIDAGFSLIRELKQIGNGNYTLTTAFTYIAWTLPRRSYEMFGVAAVLGGVIGLGALAPTSELTALRAAGYAKGRLAAAAALTIVALMIPVMWIGDTLGPEGERRAQSVSVSAKSLNMVVTNSSGMWARDGNELLNAKQGRVLPSGIELVDTRLYRFDANGLLLAITRSELTTFRDGIWQFHQVKRYRFTVDAVATDHFDTLAWPSHLDPHLLSLSIVQPRYQRIADLRSHIAYLRHNGLDDGAFVTAYWSRIFFPISVLAPLLIALPLVFGALRSGGFGKRVFLGLLIAVGYFIVLQPTAVNLAQVVGIHVVWAYTLPALLLLTSGVYWLRRP
ncbi:MAG: LPS export ABC transporter permease LptG [Lysobacterales bacterium CG02_land_8_20_14_3_00_62_12]|nr:MAG: LPS export ABC transporter permease LptG [Xanthomonadales bacterium CG02_land_8_20_14_3_00_62_12]